MVACKGGVGVWGGFLVTAIHNADTMSGGMSLE